MCNNKVRMMTEEAAYSEKIIEDLFEQFAETVDQEDRHIVQSLKKKLFPKLDEAEEKDV